MLKQLRIQNFKAWADQLWEPGLDLAPLTLLLGTNSGGKTSILQSLLLLKQTFTGPDPSLSLNLGGHPTDLIDLGSFESLIHDHDLSRSLGLGFTLETEGLQLDYGAHFRQPGPFPQLSRLELQSPGAQLRLRRDKDGAWLLNDGRLPARVPSDADPVQHALSPTLPLLEALGSDGMAIQDLSLRIRQHFTQLSYLGPLREPPDRSYSWRGMRPGTLGTRGQFATMALLSDSIQAESENRPPTMLQEVNRWVSKLGIADHIRLVRQGASRHYELLVCRGGRETNIVDVGFGVSQIFPVLILTHYVPEGSTLIIEQPELHLHPRAQLALADLLVEISQKRRVQLIVETHSEHLFRRVQTLIANERLDAADCRLYFADRDAQGAHELTPLRVDQYGQIANWPKAFFGDALGETERQMQHMMQRMMKASQ